MEVLRETFKTRDSAMIVIQDSVMNFYGRSYGTYARENAELIRKSVTSIQHAFAQNTFPSMKVTYDAYPEHIGHLETEGCFRCHNDAFTTDDGRKITRDCNLCHTILGQGKPGFMQITNVRDTLEFSHPVDIGTAWKEANCSECHRYLY